jgi:hypothetical protein
MPNKFSAPSHLSKNQQKKWLKDKTDSMQGAAARGQARFDGFGGNYVKLTFDNLARINGFGNLGSYELSENQSKYYRTTSTSWTVIMDLSKTYFRLQNASGEYTAADGTIQSPAENANDFLGRSHFKTK